MLPPSEQEIAELCRWTEEMDLGPAREPVLERLEAALARIRAHADGRREPIPGFLSEE